MSDIHADPGEPEPEPSTTNPRPRAPQKSGKSLPLDFLLPRELPAPEGQAIPIGYWDPEILKVHQQHGGLPVVLVMWPDEFRAFSESKGAREAKESAMAAVRGRRADDLIPLPDDAIIDQHNRRVPKAWFVRAAKAGRFAAVKEGSRYLARWSDVRAAFALERMTPEVRKTGPKEVLRETLGLKRKG
jgi:hypothetical protein